jgi:hypothetical protein
MLLGFAFLFFSEIVCPSDLSGVAFQIEGAFSAFAGTEI